MSVLQVHRDHILSAYSKPWRRRPTITVYRGFFQKIMSVEKPFAQVYGWTSQLWSDTTMTFSFLASYFTSWDTWLLVRELFSLGHFSWQRIGSLALVAFLTFLPHKSRQMYLYRASTNGLVSQSSLVQQTPQITDKQEPYMIITNFFIICYYGIYLKEVKLIFPQTWSTAYIM